MTAIETTLDASTSLTQPIVIILSPQQKVIGQFVDGGQGNGLVIARAGTGKTFLLRMLVPMMKPVANRNTYGKVRIAIAALNRDIADEIAMKIGEDGNGHLFSWGAINTFHGHGKAALTKLYKNTKMEGNSDAKCAGFNKFDRIASEIGMPPYLAAFAEKAMSMAMQRGFGVRINGVIVPMNDPKLWLELVDHYGLDDIIADDNAGLQLYDRDQLVKLGLQWAKKALVAGIRMADKVYSFNDMLYMPLYLNAKFEQYDWVLVDEAQDTNVLRREMAARMLMANGRMLWVGDDCQAINGFTGADNDALEQIESQFRCNRFKMTETRRCAKAIVALAQGLVPDFVAHKSNPEGSVSSISEEQFYRLTDLGPSDAIICRNTAPLVQAAYRLIKNGIACHVEGKEIGAGLLNIVCRWKRIKMLPVMRERLEEYKQSQIAKHKAKKNDQLAEAVEDRVDTIFAIIDGMPNGSTVDDLKTQIEKLFEKTPKGTKPKTLSLMTAHRSKGLEFNRVFGWGVEKFFPSKWAAKPWQLQQERNLQYVLYTRAMNNYVGVRIA